MPTEAWWIYHSLAKYDYEYAVFNMVATRDGIVLNEMRRKAEAGKCM